MQVPRALESFHFHFLQQVPRRLESSTFTHSLSTAIVQEITFFRYGLYAEQLSGTAFTAPRKGNQRSWLYRILPSVKHQPFVPFKQVSLFLQMKMMWFKHKTLHNQTIIASQLFSCSGLGNSKLGWTTPEPKSASVETILIASVWRKGFTPPHDFGNKDVFCRQMKVWNPQELSQKLALFSKIDFVDGLRTVAGAGSPRTRHGLAIHIFACNSRWGKASKKNRFF